MGGIGNQFKDVRIFKNQIFNLIWNFMAGIKLKARGLGVDGILRIPSIDARDAQPRDGSFQTIREVFRQFELACQRQKTLHKPISSTKGKTLGSFQTIQTNLSKAETLHESN
jgi:hypothetical protein